MDSRCTNMKDIMDSLHLHYKDMVAEELSILSNVLTKLKMEYVDNFDPNNQKKIGDMISILRAIQDVYDLIDDTCKFINQNK